MNERVQLLAFACLILLLSERASIDAQRAAEWANGGTIPATSAPPNIRPSPRSRRRTSNSCESRGADRRSVRRRELALPMFA